MIETTTISSKGQVTIPASFRDKLGLSAGSKVAFIDGEDGNVYVMNASILSLKRLQDIFQKVADEKPFENEEQAMAFAIDTRKGRK
ncbi:MAG: AbrB/MazE/SpoVT family DNA-binding domain-containing protein [Bacilli bacterium]|nr:AbrB/MazE/SpoVT family DNA-binding domain-containing protein [Bacilli bacterium]